MMGFYFSKDGLIAIEMGNKNLDMYIATHTSIFIYTHISIHIYISVQVFHLYIYIHITHEYEHEYYIVIYIYLFIYILIYIYICAYQPILIMAYEQAYIGASIMSCRESCARRAIIRLCAWLTRAPGYSLKSRCRCCTIRPHLPFPASLTTTPKESNFNNDKAF